MSFKNWSNIVRLLPFALVAIPAYTAERHNLIVLLPTELPAAAVNEVSAPALQKLKSEGVHFSNSHAGFPRLVMNRPDATDACPDVSSVLAAAAAAASHSTALVDSTVIKTEPDLLTTGSSHHGSSLNTIVDVTLPRFKAANKPFVLVYRFGRKSDGAKKLLHRRTDGNEAPAWVNAAITADEALAAIEDKLQRLGLYDTTNIIVAAERGSSIAWKGGQSNSWINLAAEQARWGTLPPGFLVMDLAAALAHPKRRWTVFDPDYRYAMFKDWPAPHPRLGNGVIGQAYYDPEMYVQARGDHDFIYLAKYLSGKNARHFAKEVIQALFLFAYTSGVFVNEHRVGRQRGALSMEHLGWHGTDKVPLPDIVVTFASVGVQCDEPTLCTHAIADTPLEEGQVLKGSFSRADTWNFMAARGPDFRNRVNSATPASNADLVRTMEVLLGLPVEASSSSSARVLVESLRGYEGKAPKVRRREIVSRETADGITTEVHILSVGKTRYFHAAGGPGWTVGIPMREASLEWRPWRWDWSVLRRVRVDVSPKDPPLLERAPPVFPTVSAQP